MTSEFDKQSFAENPDWDDDYLLSVTQPSNSSENNSTIIKFYQLSTSDIGERIDKVATQAFHEFSREQIKNWLTSGELTANQQPQKPKYRLKAGDNLYLNATLAIQQDDLPENIPLNIVYEDEDVLVINKPVGMVVHAGAGHLSGTLVNALLYHYPENRVLARAGLVHRIDKDTSGLLIIAKQLQSQLHLINQLKDKSVYRHYQALIFANPEQLNKHRIINLPIARHPTQRTKMAVVSTGKPAITHIDKVTAICDGVSLVDLRLETGRTHQIRVHLSHLGFPLIGDPVYGSTRKLAILLKSLNETQQNVLKNFKRQALHAYELGFIHPQHHHHITVQAKLPNDIQQLIKILNNSFDFIDLKKNEKKY